MSSARLAERGFVRDPRARSLSFYATRPSVHVDAALLDDLRATADEHDGSDVRLCLHRAPADAFHEMIILQHRGGYFRPHRHADKGESCHVLEGEAALLVFDDRGAVTEAYRLDSRRGPLARVSPGQWHTVLPVSARILYHEAKPGPFLGAGDSLFPAWAPDARDAGAAATYLATLYAAFERPEPPACGF